MLKKRLFVDMDGVLAVFNYVNTKVMYGKGYFLNLKPQKNIVKAINSLMDIENLDVFILSAYLVNSLYALEEKKLWLDKYMLDLKKENIIFTPVGSCKADYIGGINKSDYLIDDYTYNLKLWEEKGGTGIKLLNDLNHTKETWRGNRINFNKNWEIVREDILGIIFRGSKVFDSKPVRRMVVW